jgi:histidine triad (HIT) family protein
VNAGIALQNEGGDCLAECLFCRIVNKEIPSTAVYEDDLVFAFRDVSPQAPVHVLFVPKKHITSLAQLDSEDPSLIGHLFLKLSAFAATEPSLRDGYRVVANSGRAGGQTVAHLHFHVLGGRQMGWPPG